MAADKRNILRGSALKVGEDLLVRDPPLLHARDVGRDITGRQSANLSLIKMASL